MKIIVKFILLQTLLLTIMLFSNSCSSTKVSNTFAPPKAHEYVDFIRKFTDSHIRYDGLVQLFSASSTILNSHVVQATINRQAQLMRWEPQKLATEKEKKLQELKSSAQFLVLIYTPERDYNDLDRGNASIWRVYLHHKGSRYNGVVKKSPFKFIILKTLFPHITRFHKPYIVTFDLPMTAIERDLNEINLVSLLGSMTLMHEGQTL